MQGRRSRWFSLTFKVDFLLITALALGIGAVMAAFAVSLVGFRDQLTTQSLKRQGDDHFVAVETLMISGNAPEAVGYFSKVNLTSPATSITLYRRDGTMAFSDNSTIERVNRNLKTERFQLMDRPPQTAAPMPTPRFNEAAGLPPPFRSDRCELPIKLQPIDVQVCGCVDPLFQTHRLCGAEGRKVTFWKGSKWHYSSPGRQTAFTQVPSCHASEKVVRAYVPT